MTADCCIPYLFPVMMHAFIKLHFTPDLCVNNVQTLFFDQASAAVVRLPYELFHEQIKYTTIRVPQNR